METGDRPCRDTGVIDDWDDNDSPCLLALREGAKFGDDQPLDLVFGLWDFFHVFGHLSDKPLLACTQCGVSDIKHNGRSSIFILYTSARLHKRSCFLAQLEGNRAQLTSQ